MVLTTVIFVYYYTRLIIWLRMFDEHRPILLHYLLDIQTIDAA